MTPNEAMEELASIIVQTCVHPFRREHITEAEWDQIIDRMLLRAQVEKDKFHGSKTTDTH